jgi:hypothetical protein
VTERHAGMSAEAATLYQQLTEEGFEIPQCDQVTEYRAAVRAGFEAAVQVAVTGFDGVIEMIDSGGVHCRNQCSSGP